MDIKNKTFLVTGGAGFIGSHACDFIIANGGKAVCVDNLSNGKIQNLSHLLKNKNLSFFQEDVNNFQKIKSIFDKAKPDYLMHYAAVVGVKRTIAEPLKVFDDFRGIQNLTRLSRRYKIKKIFFSSSSEVYGEPLKLPVNEDDSFNARLPYGLVKILSEKYLQEFSKTFKIPVTIARFFNVYGPRQDFGQSGFVVSIFLKNALEGKPMTVFGNGSQTRDFVYVDDNIRLSFKAFFSNNLDGQPLNIGSGKSIKIKTLAQIVKKLVKGTRIVYQPMRDSGEIIYRQPDVRLMKKMLRDKPLIRLEEGLAKTIDYLKTIL